MTEYTPGQWRVEPPMKRMGYTVWAQVDRTGSMQICETGHAEYDIANARLIAAAPELLDVLKNLYDHTKNNLQICGLNEKAKAAIAKAEGEE